MRVEKNRLLDLLESENATLSDALASSEEQMRTLRIALSEQTLQVVSYDTIRDRISSLRIPFAKAQHNALQALLDGNMQNTSAISALPETSPGVADTDEALRRIDDLSRANNAIRDAMERAAAAGATDVLDSSCQRAMAANDALIADLQNVIAQIEAYAAASSSFYQEAQRTAQALSSASSSVASGLARYGYGDTSLMKESLLKLSDAEVAKRLGISKQEFTDMQREQYGFDEETAQAMWDIYAALYSKYPNADQQYIDWMWLRIMSQTDYNGNEWNITAGQVSGVGDDGELVSGDDFVTQTLGIDPDEWAKLKLAIAMQHALCDGNTNLNKEEEKKLRQLYRDVYKTEDGFSDYIGTAIQKYEMHDNPSPHGSPDKVAYADFSHQCATSAALYLDSTGIDLLFSGGSNERKDYAGWLGDCLIKGDNEGDATLGPDDYKADLDADNISRRARGQGTSYQQAARDYYNEIATGATNRADEFLSNHNGYDNIVNSIYENLQHEDIPLLYTDKEVEITHDDFFHDENILFFKHSVPNTPTSIEEKEDAIGKQKHLQETKRFLDALKEHRNDL